MFDGQEFPRHSTTRADSRSRSKADEAASEGSRDESKRAGALKLLILHDPGRTAGALPPGVSSQDLVKQVSDEEYQEVADLKLLSAQHAAERVALGEVSSGLLQADENM